MVHHVVPEVDAGPVIATVEVPIHGDDTLEALEARHACWSRPSADSIAGVGRQSYRFHHALLVAAIRQVLDDSSLLPA